MVQLAFRFSNPLSSKIFKQQLGEMLKPQNFTMENGNIEHSTTRKRIREPPAVPFLWELRPGIAKKDWKPEDASVAPHPHPSPIKFITSVPFIWEEKPGKPLACFPRQPRPPVALLCLPAPPASQPDDGDETDGGSSYCSSEDTWMSETDAEIDSLETDDSFSSAPALMANCLIPSSAIYTAVPVQDNDDPSQMPSSPVSETDSSTSSYATGASSLVGSSFLEWLFPLLPAKSGFLGKLGHSCEEEESSQLPIEFERESNRNTVIRKPLTLGELIMMSRRRSYITKAVQMRKQNLSMDKMRKRNYGCFSFGASIRFIEGKRWKFQSRMKLL